MRKTTHSSDEPYLTGAKIIKPMDAWYIRDGQSFLDRVYAVENLKHKMDL